MNYILFHVLRITKCKVLISLALIPCIINGAELSGKVTDTVTGSPVVGAEVWLESTLFSDTTDINGNYFLGDVPPGVYTIIVQSINYQQWVVSNYNISAGTDVQDDIFIGSPVSLKLLPNFPNPFNPSTSIQYYLPQSGKADLKIYNIKGKEIIKLVDRLQNQGEHLVSWFGTDESGAKVPSGIYIYKLKVNNTIRTKRMILIK